MSNNIQTSVIGSYPIKIDTTKFMNNYFSKKLIQWNSYINEAVSDMNKSGISMISDGQTRDPFVQIFTRKLKGCRIRARTEIVEKIEYDKPITVNDQKYVRSILPDNKGLLGVITGPFTLAKSSIDLFYRNEMDMAFDFAKALSYEAENLQPYVDMISIDEPFFSNEIPDYSRDLEEIITKKVTCKTRLHACGDVSKIIPELLELPVDILSHEFKASPNLLIEFSKYKITKNICLGSVRSDDSRIEPVEEIIEHVKKGYEVFGDKIVQIAPDCGQRMLPRSVAFQKLKNLAVAGEKINGR
jgi:5-methyltetrahydropteroyltriglutamate--homocysteine methyltransferase